MQEIRKKKKKQKENVKKDIEVFAQQSSIKKNYEF